jgi:hypothetical protein
MAFENLWRRLGWQRESQPTRRYQRHCGEEAAWKFTRLSIPGRASRKGRQGGMELAQPHKKPLLHY